MGWLCAKTGGGRGKIKPIPIPAFPLKGKETSCLKGKETSCVAVGIPGFARMDHFPGTEAQLASDCLISVVDTSAVRGR